MGGGAQRREEEMAGENRRERASSSAVAVSAPLHLLRFQGLDLQRLLARQPRHRGGASTYCAPAHARVGFGGPFGAMRGEMEADLIPTIRGSASLNKNLI